jgi:hypothetical protein
MKKTSLIFCSILCFLLQFSVSKAQVSFSHSAGLSAYIGGSAAAWGLNYSPRLNLLELGDELTFSLGTHLGLGLQYSSQEGSSNSFTLDLPLMAEINFGHASSPETSSSFGGFGGIGYGISKIGSDGVYGADYNNAAGLVINGGVRFIVKERPVGVRLSYMLNFKGDAKNVLAFGAFYTFGDFK